jgi:hypothetical protein
MKNNVFFPVLEKLNASRVICNHLIGEKHTSGHRAVTGVIIMVFGVCVAKSAVYIHIIPVHILLDLVGYLIHAIGAIPILNSIESHKIKKDATRSTDRQNQREHSSPGNMRINTEDAASVICSHGRASEEVRLQTSEK